MKGFFVILKMNFKLLLRNKGYLFFVLVLPIISILLLNIPSENAIELEDSNRTDSIRTEDTVSLNIANNKMNLKVYDCSNSALSNYLLDELLDLGLFNIYKSSESLTKEEAQREATDYANRNNVSAILYIPNDLTKKALSGNFHDTIYLFKAFDDDRILILKSSINAMLTSISNISQLSSGDITEFNDLTNNLTNPIITKEVIGITEKNTKYLTAIQQAKSFNIGYSLAIVSIGFLFSGVFIASIFIKEKENRVYKRILLSDTSIGCYIGTKFILAFLTVMIQITVMGLGIKFFVKTDFGISLFSYLFFVFGLGIVFNILSMVTGILTNNILSSNYIAFFVWCLSAMISGLYFPLDAASEWWSRVSLLMPQRWVIKSAEMLILGQNSYLMYSMVMLGFLVVITSIGFLGLKVTRRE